MKLNIVSNKILQQALLLLGLCPVGGGFAQINSTSTNMLKNSGFEDSGKQWRIPGEYATIVNDQSYEGKYSIHYKNENNEAKPVAKAITQMLVVAPGETIHFNVWVKGKAVDAAKAGNKNFGARIYIQSYDESGKLINGYYSTTSGIGTFDWKQIGGSYTVPINAVNISLGIGLHPGVTGEVWFDDAFLGTEKPPMFESFLVFPNYRGLILHHNNSDWTTDVRITPQSESISLKKGSVVYQLKDSNGKILLKKGYEVNIKLSDTLLRFTPPRNLPLGNYSLEMAYFSPERAVLLKQNHLVKIVSSMPVVYVDKDGFTVKDGKRIFPLGLYISQHDDDDFQRIKDAKFNTILSYGYSKGASTYLDRANKYGLNVVYSLKDLYEGSKNITITDPVNAVKGYINELKGKPALLSWYTVDELLPEWLPKIRSMYENILNLDPNHPTFQVHYYEGHRMLEKYYYTTDIIATDPYPIGKSDLTLTTTRTAASMKGMHGSRGVWTVPQIMDWAVYQKDRKPKPPTLDEMRNQAYQSIIAGAKGLIFYTYYDLFSIKYPRNETRDIPYFNNRWKDVTAMSNEVNDLIPAILNGKRIDITIKKNENLAVSTLEYNGDLLILLANPYYSESSISMELPKGWDIAEMNQGHINASASGNVLTFILPSIGSGFFKLVKKKGP